jgi:hypothetical protein
MQYTLNPYIAIPIIVVASLTSLGLWYVFVRPVEQVTGTGTIVGRDFYEAETVEKTVQRTFRGPEYLPRHSIYRLPDRFVYRVRIDGLNQEASFTIPAVGKQEMDIGSRVSVTYSRRGLPFIWSKIYVTKVDALE